jgi:hypothetical protein
MTAPSSMGVSDVVRVDRSLTAVARRRMDGSFDTDAWGLDADLVSVLGRVLPTFGVRTTGAGRVPDGPALLLWRGSSLGWIHVAAGIGSATGRPVRFTGVPDVAPASTVLRRLGGVGGDVSDLRGLLRLGNLVAMRLAVGQDPLEESLAGLGWAGEDLGAPVSGAAANGPTPGPGPDVVVDDWLPDDEVEAAVHVGVPVVPVMVHGPRPWAPWARVVVGDPVPTRTRRAARSLAEVAASVATSFADLA